MKLRIKGNSIRFRLAQGEVTRLAERGKIWAETDFGAARLRYGVEGSDLAVPQAEFAAGVLRLRVPAAELHHWATSDQVSLHAQQPLSKGALKLLLEKDFQCLQPREDEDESDLFPHPEAAGP